MKPLKTYICGCVRDCEKYLRNVFKNITTLISLFDDYTVSSKEFFEVGGNFNEFLIMGEGDYIQVSSTHSCTFIVSVVEYDNQFKNL